MLKKKKKPACRKLVGSQDEPTGKSYLGILSGGSGSPAKRLKYCPSGSLFFAGL